MAVLPGLRDGVRRGRLAGGGEVTYSLFRRATGYETTEQRIFMHRGKAIFVPYGKHHRPPTGASMNWLCNRQPRDWSWHGQREETGEVPDIFARRLLPVVESVHHEQGHRHAGKQGAAGAAQHPFTHARMAIEA